MRYGSPWMPWMHGGSQERRRRGGTLNVPGIVGLAKALELVMEERDHHLEHFRGLRERLIGGVSERYNGQVTFNCDPEHGVPHIINMGFSDGNGGGLDGEMLLLNLDMEGICVSNGSACTSGAVEPSHVLSGIGLDEAIANASIRISLGKDNTEEDVDYFLESLESDGPHDGHRRLN
ncbi:MAG: aminotransferase class V-fold PLP-dependent enzyme [Balneolaceae bacterium]|nr:aminotransferase class V-fold PLP-dependent enzyme [Balneolaceae bacterium]